MNIINAIRTAHKKQFERKYEYLYWSIDVHGVILEPTYKLHNEGAKYYPLALETLKLISDDPVNKIILWTSSFMDETMLLQYKLNEYGIKLAYINSNPECPNTATGNFTTKFYFDVLLDDKAGFEPETDWGYIHKYMDVYNRLPKSMRGVGKIVVFPEDFPVLEEAEIVGAVPEIDALIEKIKIQGKQYA